MFKSRGGWFYNDNLFIAITLALVIPLLFYNITKLPINLWDESRLAISAYEMYKTNNFLVVTFGFDPEMWSTKPPLMIWLQALSMKIFGVNEFSVRLPTILSAIGILISSLFFSLKYLKSKFIALAVCLTIITSSGFMELHVARTGDYDVMLIFFMLLSIISIFIYVEEDDNKWMYYFFTALTLAALTKGIAAMLFGPAIVIYLLLKGKFIKTIKNKHTYFGLLIFIIFVFGYYLLREMYNPGYIKAVYEQELGGRFLDTLGEHSHPFFYYLDNLYNFQYKHWFMFAMSGGVLSYLKLNKVKSKYIDFSRFGLIISITYLLIISVGKTKLEWYPAPLYPIFAFMVASFLIISLEFILSNEWVRDNFRSTIFPIGLLSLIYFIPYKNVLQKIHFHNYYGFNLANIYGEKYLKEILENKRKLNAEYIATDGYNPHIHFYVYALKERGIELKFINCREMKGGETVVTHQPENKEYIHSKYNYEIIEEVGLVKLIKILGIKSQ